MPVMMCLLLIFSFVGYRLTDSLELTTTHVLREGFPMEGQSLLSNVGW